MPYEIGNSTLTEGANAFISPGIAWSGKLSLTNELLITRDGKPVVGGVHAMAQLFRLRDIPTGLLAVLIDRDKFQDLHVGLEDMFGRAFDDEEIVTIVTLSVTSKQAEIINSKDS